MDGWGYGAKIVCEHAAGRRVQMSETKRKTATYVLVSGGHAFECLALAERLKGHLESTYLVFRSDPITRARIADERNVVELPGSFQEVRRKGIWRVLLDVPGFVAAVWLSFRALRTFRTDVVISTGSGPALAPMLAAKALRRKVVFVESATRVTGLSLCGSVAYRFLADQFFVQWEGLTRSYPRAIFAGRLF